MRKLLIAFDGTNYSNGAMEFAKMLNKRNPILLTGAFMPQINYANLWSYSGGGRAGNIFIPLVEDDEAMLVKKNISLFESFCNYNDITYCVHKDFFNFTIQDLKRESRFADLLIISSERFYQRMGDASPNEYLQEALHSVECPVLVVPERFEFPRCNVLAYDGTEGSVYAIKQFTYLFPELLANPSILIYANDKGDDSLPESENIKELTGRHFLELSYLHLEAHSGKSFANWMAQRSGVVLVSGAFGRSDFSMFFHKSFVSDVIHNLQVPVFIAHK